MVNINIHDARHDGNMAARFEDLGPCITMSICAGDTEVTYFLPPECTDAVKRAVSALNDIAYQRKLAAE
jgi:hypothetical protein